MRYFYVLLIQAALMQSIFVYGQSGVADISSLYQKFEQERMALPPAEAYSFSKYNSNVISGNHGLPEINIPIHTIDLDGLNIPISISYYNEGCFVDRQASIIGLGWILNAGGIISIPGMMSEFPNKRAQALIDSTHIYNWHPDPCGDENDLYLYGLCYKNFVGEYTRCTYDAPGLSGAFYNIDKGVFATVPFDPRVNSVSDKKLISNQGFIYEFNEYGSRSVKGGGIKKNASTQYLSKITSPKGNVVEFLYKKNRYEYPTVLEKSFLRYDNITYAKNLNKVSGTVIQKSEIVDEPILQSIKFGLGEIKFIYSDNERLDVTGKKRLIKVELFYNGKLVDEHKLFNNNYFGKNVWLKLDSIQKNDEPPTIFFYNEENCPLKYESPVDSYGYYSSSSKERDIFKTNGIDVIFQGEISPNYKLMQSCMITGVEYPTGGKSEYEYYCIPGRIFLKSTSDIDNNGEIKSSRKYHYDGESKCDVGRFGEVTFSIDEVIGGGSDIDNSCKEQMSDFGNHKFNTICGNYERFYGTYYCTSPIVKENSYGNHVKKITIDYNKAGRKGRIERYFGIPDFENQIKKLKKKKYNYLSGWKLSNDYLVKEIYYEWNNKKYRKVKESVFEFDISKTPELFYKDSCRLGLKSYRTGSEFSCEYAHPTGEKFAPISQFFSAEIYLEESCVVFPFIKEEKQSVTNYYYSLGEVDSICSSSENIYNELGLLKKRINRNHDGTIDNTYIRYVSDFIYPDYTKSYNLLYEEAYERLGAGEDIGVSTLDRTASRAQIQADIAQQYVEKEYKGLLTSVRSSTDASFLSAIKELSKRHITGAPIEVLSTFQLDKASNELITNGIVQTYKNYNGIPYKFETYESPTGHRFTNFGAQKIGDKIKVSSHYKLKNSNIEYNSKGKLLSYKNNANIYTSFIYGYDQELPVARAFNAKLDEIEYTSFELEDDNWSGTFDRMKSKDSYSGEYSCLLRGTGNVIGEILCSENIKENGLSLEFWINGKGRISVSLDALSPVSKSLTPIKSYKTTLKNNHSWVKKSLEISSVELDNIEVGSIIHIDISTVGSFFLDNIRVSPKNSLFETFDYKPLIGVTAITDNKGQRTKFKYEDKKLKEVFSFEDNLVKSFDYNFQNGNKPFAGFSVFQGDKGFFEPVKFRSEENGYDYKWKIENTLISNNSNELLYQFEFPGNYEVSLTLEKSGEVVGNCIKNVAIDSIYAPINFKIATGISIINPRNFCYSYENIEIYTPLYKGLEYKWIFSENEIIEGIDKNKVKKKFKKSGKKEVELQLYKDNVLVGRGTFDIEVRLSNFIDDLYYKDYNDPVWLYFRSLGEESGYSYLVKYGDGSEETVEMQREELFRVKHKYNTFGRLECEIVLLENGIPVEPKEIRKRSFILKENVADLSVNTVHINCGVRSSEEQMRGYNSDLSKYAFSILEKGVYKTYLGLKDISCDYYYEVSYFNEVKNKEEIIHIDGVHYSERPSNLNSERYKKWERRNQVYKRLYDLKILHKDRMRSCDFHDGLCVSSILDLNCMLELKKLGTKSILIKKFNRNTNSLIESQELNYLVQTYNSTVESDTRGCQDGGIFEPFFGGGRYWIFSAIKKLRDEDLNGDGIPDLLANRFLSINSFDDLIRYTDDIRYGFSGGREDKLFIPILTSIEDGDFGEIEEPEKYIVYVSDGFTVKMFELRKTGVFDF
ncbi:MAG: hypothetical protein ACEPOV_13755 [Hyphomicrobiales bacterium]